MIKNADYKRQILRENYDSVEQSMSFREWVDLTSENDPSFFRWLFEVDNLSDFECPSREDFENFLDSL